MLKVLSLWALLCAVLVLVAAPVRATAGPLEELLNSDEQELSDGAQAVLATTSAALSPADQQTLSDMLHESEGVELVGEDGSLDEQLAAEEEALEEAANDEVAQEAEAAAVEEASSGQEVSEESAAEVATEDAAEEGSAGEEVFLQIAEAEADASDEDEVADDMSESPALIEAESDEDEVADDMSESPALLEVDTLFLEAQAFVAAADEHTAADEAEDESEEEAEDESEDEEEAEDESEAEAEEEAEDEAEDEAEFEDEESADDMALVETSVLVGAPLEAVTTTAETAEQVEADAEAAEQEDAAAAEAEAQDSDVSAAADEAEGELSEEMVINAEGEGVWQDVQTHKKPRQWQSPAWNTIQSFERAAAPKPAVQLIPAASATETPAAPAAAAPKAK